MPSAPAEISDRPTRHGPAEFRVSFRSRPTTALLVPPDAPLPPLKAAVALPASAPPSSLPSPIDPWQTAVGQQVRAEGEQVRAALDALKRAADQVKGQFDERLDEWQKAAVALAALVATRLMHQQITADEFPIEAMVRDMAAQLMDDDAVSVRLNPADLELLEKRLDGEPLLPGRDDPRLLADATLPRGDCRVDGRAGMQIADAARSLQELTDDLLRSMGHAGP